MKNEILKKVAKLIDLKSILSIIVVSSYTIMCFIGKVEADYKDLVIMIMTFYFASKVEKKGNDSNINE